MRGKGLVALGGALGLLTVACGGGGGGGDANPGGSAGGAASPAAATTRFVDATAASGIAYTVGYRNLASNFLVSEFATSGVAAGDYDLDGDIDLLITRGDIGPNLLYRNDGRGVFADVAASAGVAFTATPTENYRHSGPTFADMDGDRDLDLFIGGLFGDPSFVFANNGDGTFSDVTAGSGIDGLEARHNISAAFGDYDLDGDLDLFVAHWGTDGDLQSPRDTEHLWRNDTAPGGPIRFTSVSIEAGISATIINPIGTAAGDPGAPLGRDYTFTPSFARVNADLYPDILSVADYGSTRLFMNNGDGTFRDATDDSAISDEYGMGSALGDYDHDGDLDWFVSSIHDPSVSATGNRLYRNDGGTFTDVTQAAGVRAGGWGWGACFAELDNDGDLDLYLTNGWGSGFEEDVSVAYISQGDGTFAERGSQLGLADRQQGRGVVCADFDNDGDIDILQLHRGSPYAATFWRNNLTSGNYLAVKLVGLSPNTHAAGARIYASIGGRTQMREVSIGNNFVSQNPTVTHFGLGLATQVDELRVEWPDGAETVLHNVAAGQKLRIHQPAAG
jgi:hypothetical protein